MNWYSTKCDNVFASMDASMSHDIFANISFHGHDRSVIYGPIPYFIYAGARLLCQVSGTRSREAPFPPKSSVCIPPKIRSSRRGRFLPSPSPHWMLATNRPSSPRPSPSQAAFGQRYRPRQHKSLSVLHKPALPLGT